MKLSDLIENLRVNWPSGACSKFHDIDDYSGHCGQCGWEVEGHEYLHDEPQIETAVVLPNFIRIHLGPPGKVVIRDHEGSSVISKICDIQVDNRHNCTDIVIVEWEETEVGE